MARAARTESCRPVDRRSSPLTRDTIASWTRVVTCIRARSGMRIIFCPSWTLAPCWISPRSDWLQRLFSGM